MLIFASKIEKIKFNEVEYELYPYNLGFLLSLENGKSYNLLEKIELNSNIPKEIIEKMSYEIAMQISNKLDEISELDNNKKGEKKK